MYLKRAFSLIEILIALIILSLLLTAFIPLISKKMKANDITVGSFGTGGGDKTSSTVLREVTKEDCDKFDALYIPKEMNDGVKPVCVTKYNVGDRGISTQGAKVVDVGVNCSGGNCCWRGVTSNNCSSDGNADSDYDGCNRTVCQWSAANNSCLSYAPTGTMARDWRLPTKKEMVGWEANIAELSYFKGKNGLMLCSYNSKAYGSVLCSHKKICNGSNDGFCWPHRMWAGECNASDCYGHQNELNSTGQGLIFSPIGVSSAQASSARCVLDRILDVENKVEEPKEELSYKEPQSQADCDPYNALFIHGYFNGPNGKNLCVTKRNALDEGGPTKPSGVNVVNVGQSCASSTSACCWKGQTAVADTCTSGYYGNYSGCKRSVCNYKAADMICSAWAPAGSKAGYWRLPTYEELQGWATNIGVVSENIEKSGLQLCAQFLASNSNFTSGMAAVCNMVLGCMGVNDNYCRTMAVWGKEQSGFSYIYDAAQSGAMAFINTSNEKAFSVRCVTDKVPK